MDAATLIQKALEQREQWVPLTNGDGKRVRVRRPAAAEMFQYGRARTPELFLRTAVDWDGFTEADVLGRGVGGSDPVPFDADLWVTLALDRIDWIGDVSEAITATISEYITRTASEQKNLRPFSKPKRGASSTRAN